jgi:hypothetical protein
MKARNGMKEMKIMAKWRNNRNGKHATRNENKNGGEKRK